MFDNIGSKLMWLAKALFWIVFIEFALGGLITGFILLDDSAIGILPLLGGPLFGLILGWLSGCFIYAFGRLVENSEILVRQTQAPKNPVSSPAPAAQKQNVNAVPSSPASVAQKNDAAPVSPVSAEKAVPGDSPFERLPDGRLRCLHCGTVQNGNRKVCFSCGATFIE